MYVLTNSLDHSTKISICKTEYEKILWLAQKNGWTPKRPMPNDNRKFEEFRTLISDYLVYEFVVGQEDAENMAIALNKGLDNIKKVWNSNSNLQLFFDDSNIGNLFERNKKIVERMIVFLKLGCYEYIGYDKDKVDDLPF